MMWNLIQYHLQSKKKNPYKENPSIFVKLTTKAVKDEETLETGTLIGQFTNTVEYKVNDFLANGVVTTSVVVS